MVHIFTIFFIRSAIFVYVDRFGWDVFGINVDSLTSYSYKMLMDQKSELFFVTSIRCIFTLPQIIAYILSALSGSASSPVFVSSVSQFAIWSMIKCLATVAEIFLANLPASLLGNGSIDYGYMLNSLINITTAFVMTSLYINSSIFWRLISDTKWLHFLKRCHDFATRHTSRVASDRS